MYSHLTVGSNDLTQSKKFYDAVFTAAGGNEAFVAPTGSLVYTHKDSVFVVCSPLDGEPATHANGGTIGLTMDSTEQTDAWHAAGVDNGGKSIEDPPGWRESGVGPMYLAYLRDPDGNKLCAVYREPA